MKSNQFLVFDFDSTITSVEALDVLADQKASWLGSSVKEQIASITNQAMNGSLSFKEALEQRIQLLQLTRLDIESLIPFLKSKISSSFLAHRTFFENHPNQIAVISGGFEEYIIPVVNELGIHSDYVFANRFLEDLNGLLYADPEAALSRNQGKVIALEALPFQGEITAVGDGFTDYEMKAIGKANRFILYAEHVNRSAVIPAYDQIIFSLDELIQDLHG